MTSNGKIKTVVEAPCEFTSSECEPRPIVISSRIRLAPNIEPYPFPGWASDKQREAILSMASQALKKLPELKSTLKWGITFRKES